MIHNKDYNLYSPANLLEESKSLRDELGKEYRGQITTYSFRNGPFDMRCDMEQLKNYLSSLRGDIFKLLPMKEVELNGTDNHINEYIDSLIINLTGALATYPALASQKQYLYVLNNMQYIRSHYVEFKQWRKIILNSTRNIDNLYTLYMEETDGNDELALYSCWLACGYTINAK